MCVTRGAEGTPGMQVDCCSACGDRSVCPTFCQRSSARPEGRRSLPSARSSLLPALRVPIPLPPSLSILSCYPGPWLGAEPLYPVPVLLLLWLLLRLLAALLGRPAPHRRSPSVWLQGRRQPPTLLAMRGLGSVWVHAPAGPISPTILLKSLGATRGLCNN